LRPTPSSLSGFFGTFDLSLGVETFSARGRRHRHIDVFPTATSSLSPRNQPIDTTQAPKHVTSSHAPRPRQRPGDEETKCLCPSFLPPFLATPFVAASFLVFVVTTPPSRES
jgi:hypothetical protein